MKQGVFFCFWIVYGLFILGCSNQKANDKGKLRLHTILVPKIAVLNLTPGQTLFFNIDFENRKLWKEHIRLLGYRVMQNEYSTDTVKLPSLKEDTVVHNDKLFGNYFLNKALVDTIRKMEADRQLENIDYILLKPVVYDTSRNYIHYDVLIGLNEKDITTSKDGLHVTINSTGATTLSFLSIGRLDPSPPAPPPS